MNEAEVDLPIVESLVPAPHRSTQPRVEGRRRTAPDATAAHGLRRQTRGFVEAVDRLLGLGQPSQWVEMANYSVCHSTGGATDGVYLFGASFPGYSLTMQDSLSNCFAYFAGASEPWLDTDSPNSVPGYIVCPLDAAGGTYLFMLQVETGTDPYDPDPAARTSRIEICLDNQTVTIRTLPANQQTTVPVLARLGRGRHLFQIVQEGNGGFYFQDVTVWQIPSVGATQS